MHRTQTPKKSCKCKMTIDLDSTKRMGRRPACMGNNSLYIMHGSIVQVTVELLVQECLKFFLLMVC